MSYLLCTTCKHAGIIPQQKETYKAKWGAGANVEVIQYICPFCGAIETQAITHGVPISAAEESALQAQYSNLTLS
jgi:hypothetical protein